MGRQVGSLRSGDGPGNRNHTASIRSGVCSILRPHPHQRRSLLDPAHEKQNDKDNQNDADDPDAAVTVPVSITAEASTEFRQARR